MNDLKGMQSMQMNFLFSNHDHNPIVSYVCVRPQQQVQQYLKDMFDHDKVRFSSCPSLAEDLLRLSHRRSDILLGYLGINSLIASNGALPSNSTHSSTLEQDTDTEQVNSDPTHE